LRVLEIVIAHARRDRQYRNAVRDSGIRRATKSVAQCPALRELQGNHRGFE
jgi:hypothetical protein